MLNRIVIITPAIPRKDVHSQAVEAFYNSLQGYKEDNIEIIHIINIDCPEKVLKLGYNLEETIENFENKIPEGVKKIYLHGHKPNFTSTYIRLYEEANKYMNDNSVFIYFEDDKEVRKDIKLYQTLRLILKYRSTNNLFLIPTDQRPSNNIHIQSGGLFKHYVKYLTIKRKKILEINKDPDYIKGSFYKYYFSRMKELSINWYRIYGIEDTKYTIKSHWKNFLARNKIKNIKEFRYLNLTTNHQNLYLKNNDFKLKKIKNEKEFELFLFKYRNSAKEIGHVWRDKHKLAKWVKEDMKPKTY